MNDRRLTVLHLDREFKVAVLYNYEEAEPITYDDKGGYTPYYGENVDIIKIYDPNGINVYEILNALPHNLVDYFAEKVLEKIGE